jgi:hypothetical protein
MSEPRRDPIMHTHVSDKLDDTHPLAFHSIECRRCHETLHAFNNECMQTWVETGKGNYCIFCFVAQTGASVDEEYGLP